jgi:hypothetical protein
MTPRSRSHLTVILLVTLANLITPICAVYTLVEAVLFVFNCLTHTAYSGNLYLIAYALLETCHYAYQTYNRRTKPEQNVLVPSPEARKRFWKKAMMTLDKEGRSALDKWLTGWFVRVTPSLQRFSYQWWSQPFMDCLQYRDIGEAVTMSEIRRGNVEEFLAGTVFVDWKLRPD